MMRTPLGWSATALACVLATVAHAAPREDIPLATGWRFQLGDAPAAAEGAAFDDSRWEAVSVPHSWNRMGGSAKRRADYQDVHGAGWYRLHFASPAALNGRQAWLQFDAASEIADVWLNGAYLGQHKGGFARFRLDATKALRPSGDNVLVVRVDNSSPKTPGSPTRDIIPMSGDFPIYGGLYRPVALVLTAPVHIAMTDFGGPGTYATVTRADEKGAEASLLTRLENMSARPEKVTVEAQAIDPSGKVAATASSTTALAAGSKGAVRQRLNFDHPALWDGTDAPRLYRLRVTLRDAAGVAIDEVEQPLGLRTVRIDPDKGFFLNGRHVLLRGVSRHQDRPDKGWAITNADIDEDFALIREIGANTVRLAHYQHADRAYADADRDGLAVWAEIPLVDRSAPWDQDETSPGLAANAEQQLRELIHQNFNHPSIVVWSIANEVNLEAAKGRGTSHARPLLERLRAVVHEEDPSRPATLADCCGSIPSEARPGLDTVAGITDVIGYNRYFGWYAKTPEDLTPELNRLHALYPHQPISISEYGAGGALTQHSDDPRGGPIAAFGRPHPEEVENDVLERTWPQIAALPYVWASWVWNLTDFSNEQRNEGDLTDTNDKGLVTFDRKTRKDAFYYYKANWSKVPFVHLVGRRYTERATPLAEVKAYSNAASARLSLNGRDLGTAPCSGGICRWENVALQPGNNRFVASAAGAADDAMAWRFAGAANRWRIRSGTLTGGASPDGTLWASDVHVSGGEGHFRDQPSKSRGGEPGPVHAVAGTADQTPYGSWRSGRFSYAIPVSPGRYRVTLHFFEPDASTKPGDRLFDVKAQGRAVATGIDVAKESGGAFRALQRSVMVKVADGPLRLDFVPVKGDAILSALAVDRVGS